MKLSMSIGAAIAMLVIATPSYAQTAAPTQQIMCGPRDKFVEQLKVEFDEELESVGVASNGSALEVFTSPEGTWTMLATGPNKISCLLISGDGWISYKRIENSPEY